MLRISKLTDYATVILTYLASVSTEVVSAARVAHACQLARPTVSKLLKILTESGLLQSFRGTEGGYQMARQLHEITLADVVVAIEGAPALTECCSSEGCAFDDSCSVKHKWRYMNKKILDTLASVTLDAMIRPPADRFIDEVIT